MGVNLRGRSFLKLLDFTSAEIRYLLDLSKDYKNLKRAGVVHKKLEGKILQYYLKKTQQELDVHLK
ncbi:hypothetical protein H477_2543 [[Clostridium] sordellii ATCC 9714]|nr:hypothetical protein H477_2543 [[Clostridium] sordellii ATCC 9714] [Paeniclostridium sordellii ATCC 9714]